VAEYRNGQANCLIRCWRMAWNQTVRSKWCFD